MRREEAKGVWDMQRCRFRLFCATEKKVGGIIEASCSRARANVRTPRARSKQREFHSTSFSGLIRRCTAAWFHVKEETRCSLRLPLLSRPIHVAFRPNATLSLGLGFTSKEPSNCALLHYLRTFLPSFLLRRRSGFRWHKAEDAQVP